MSPRPADCNVHTEEQGLGYLPYSGWRGTGRGQVKSLDFIPRLKLGYYTKPSILIAEVSSLLKLEVTVRFDDPQVTGGVRGPSWVSWRKEAQN